MDYRGILNKIVFTVTLLIIFDIIVYVTASPSQIEETRTTLITGNIVFCFGMAWIFCAMLTNRNQQQEQHVTSFEPVIDSFIKETQLNSV